VEITIKDHDGALRAGMFGDATVILSEKDDALVIPFESLLFENEARKNPYCYIVSGDSARKRSLTLGIMEEDWVEVIAGLAAGDKVVTLGKENVSDGTPVEIVSSE
jgi:multidrug efflux pump subunit AcrA (membrane-fusion protein)